MLNDLRYTMRGLRRAPLFTLSAIVALALGIGANTAVFSVVYAVLLRPLPYAEPDRLVRLYERNPAQGIERGEVSPGTFVDWRSRARTLDNLAVSTLGSALWSIGDRLETVTFSAVSPAMFDVMRVRPILGRTFRPEQAPGGGDTSEVVIAYGLWQRAFGGDPHVVGRTIAIEARYPSTIIGVMPRGFSYPDGVEAWGNMSFLRPIGANQRQTRYYDVTARLAPGVTLAAARAELATISARLELEHPRSNAGWGSAIEPLAAAGADEARRSLLVLLGAVCGVLLIACANVANLLLARAAERRPEMSVRTALGASAWRLATLCLIEVTVLAVAGAAAGLVLGRWIILVLVALAPADVARFGEARLNAPVLAVALAATLGSALLIGLAPAWQAFRAERGARLRIDPRGATAVGSRLRRSLIGLQVAVVLPLLIATALLMRSFINLRHVDLGFEAEHVFAVEARWPTGRFATPTRRPWFQLQEQMNGLIDAVGSVPGVEAAGLISDLPLTGDPSSGAVWRVDAPGAAPGKAPASARDQWKAAINVVTPGVFDALGIAILRGRNFDVRDRLGEAQLMDPQLPRPPGALIVNNTFASRFFPDEDALGKTVVIFDATSFNQAWTIVGITADVRDRAVSERAEPQLFLPHDGFPDVFRPTLAVRSRLPLTSLAPAIRQRLHEFDPQLLVARERPMSTVVGEALARPRFTVVLIGAFAITALLLAAMGIYGVLMSLVAQRTREMGIRIALGARASDVLRMVIGDGMRPIVLGVVVGLSAAASVGWILRSLLFGVASLDAVSFIAAPVLLTAIALLACYLPARRATAVDPLVALRDE